MNALAWASLAVFIAGIVLSLARSDPRVAASCSTIAYIMLMEATR